MHHRLRRLPSAARAFGFWSLAFLAAVFLAASPTPHAISPATAATVTPPVSYEHDVKPLLVSRCYACHANGTKLGDFSIDSREGVLTGGMTHPVVLPGNGAGSYLIKLVSGQVPGSIMPARGPRLTDKEIDLLRAWIDQGASFGTSKTAATWTPQLAPRHPRVPAARPGSGLSNPIDLLLQPYFTANKITPRPICDDRAYMRRVYLDTVGLLPPPAEMEAFVQDKAPGKRTRLAQRLLGDKDAYAQHWLTFWNDMLRNDYAGTGYIDGGRTQITRWLYSALWNNRPYNQFVSQLVNPMPDSAGFANGIVWRGTVNASQTPAMQTAQNVSQVFMGVNLKCASCHNSFVSTWKLADAYGLAGVYSDGPLEMVRCDKPTGQTAPIKFLYPSLGAIDGKAPKAKRLAQLATAITSKANGRLTRTFVNRLWAKLMGRGLVEPTDEMDNRPWDPDLLDWLAADFADHGYDVKRTIALIVASQAYQLPAVGQASERIEDFHFTGPCVKRMTAEQFCDAVSRLTGVWSKPAASIPNWDRGTTRLKSVVLKSGSVPIDVDVTGAQVLSLVVTNGKDSANVSWDWANWVDPTIDTPGGPVKLTDLKWALATTGYGEIQMNNNITGKPLRLADRTFANGIGTHANSVITYRLPAGATRFHATAGPDTGAIEQGGGMTTLQFSVITGDETLLESRAALALADPLQRALGRPNREQVVTERQTAATTLQALELTNGKTLADMLDAGAARLVSETHAQPEQIVATIYAEALGRAPTAAERKAALAKIGSPAARDGVSDLLWTVVMLPEFQLIY